MTIYSSNIGAMNAARAQFGKAFKEHVLIEKLGTGEWTVQLKQLMDRSQAYQCLRTDLEGAFAFPTADQFSEKLVDLDNPIVAEDLTEELLAAQAQADAIANAQASETNLNGKVWIRLSSIPKPTKAVWLIADEMCFEALANHLPIPSRKAIQEECVARGIASGTARTQYQAWKKANDNDRENAIRAAEASKRFNGN